MTPIGNGSRRWRQLKDRSEWRLTAHFFRALFDFGLLSTAGADSFTRMLLGGAGGFVSFGLLITYLYAGKYAMLWARPPELYYRAVLGDDLLLVGLPMLVTAFVTLLVSDSLFPDERDFRILGPLPVRKTAVFGAKLTALSLFNGLLVAVTEVSLLPLMLLTSINPFGDSTVLSRVTAWAITSAMASMFAALVVTACIGLCVLAFSRRHRHELTAMVRSGLLLLLVLSVPVVLRLPNFGGPLAGGAAWMELAPPAWFVGLQQVLKNSDDPWFFHLASMAVAAVGAAATIVAITYGLLFRRFERLMLGSTAISPRWSEADRAPAFAHARPAFRAVHRFTMLTLRRSHLHQSVLVGLSACGLGFAMNRLIEANLGRWAGAGGPVPSSLAGAAMWTPFGLMLVCGLSARATLVLPIEHRANWIFRMTEDQATRRDQLRAVDQVVAMYVVGVPVSVAIPALWMVAGPMAVIGATVVALVGLVFVHAVLLDWRRIPFTCSYLPGKRFVAHSFVLGCFMYLLLTLTGMALVRAAISDVRHALAIATTLSFVAYVLRRRRLAMWKQTPLMFEDEFPDEPLRLRL